LHGLVLPFAQVGPTAHAPAVLEQLSHFQPFHGQESPFEVLLVHNISAPGCQHLEELDLDPNHGHILLALSIHKQQQMHPLAELFAPITQDISQVCL
jgi:hypothetical protein